MAQRKRGGPITHRSQDRNLALISFIGLPIFLSTFLCLHFPGVMIVDPERLDCTLYKEPTCISKVTVACIVIDYVFTKGNKSSFV